MIPRSFFRQISSRHTPRTLAPHSFVRHVSTATPTSVLVKKLLRNPELSHDEAVNELRWIRQHVEQTTRNDGGAGRGSIDRVMEPMTGVSAESQIAALVERRAKGEPLQYILGTTDFGPLTLLTRPPTLIPRPETSHIITLLASRLLYTLPPPWSSHDPSAFRILDLCTGSGCISLLLSHLLLPAVPDLSVHGVDISSSAIALARDNAAYTGLTRGITFAQEDLFGEDFAQRLAGDGGGGGRVDMVVSNPPYIPRDEYEKLPRSVREYEDERALLGDMAGEDQDGRGLAFYRRIADLLPDLLVEEIGEGERQAWPVVAVEVGHDQAPAVSRIFEATEVVGRTEVWDDQFGVPRMVVGFRQ